MSQWREDDQVGVHTTTPAPPCHHGEDVEMHREDEPIRREKSRRSDDIPDDVQLVEWDGPNDPDNPFNWPKSRKILLTVVVLLGTLITLLNGTAITVAYEEINHEFGISDASFPNSYWPVTSWTIGGGVFILFLLPIMEDVGVRWGYLISYAVFFIFVIPSAVCKNFATLVVVRFFAGGCVALVANAVCGIVCDIWEGDRGRSVPMQGYITMYLVGTTLGPVMGGAIYQFLPWRW